MSDLTQLGQSSAIPASPDAATLERVANPHPDTLYVARFAVPEFTSLCPVTGQPDFAHLVIDYVPADWLVESKSLKLYLASFRNHGAFHEDCTIAIGKRLVDTLSPAWLRFRHLGEHEKITGSKCRLVAILPVVNAMGLQQHLHDVRHVTIIQRVVISITLARKCP